MSLFTERVGQAASGLAMRAGAAVARAWHAESVAPKAGTVATHASTLSAARSMGGSALPGSVVPKSIMTGSAIPIDARPRTLMGGSALPVDARPKAILVGSALPGDSRPKATEWRNKAELASGLVKQEGLAIPADTRPKLVVAASSALPTPSIPKPVVEGSALPRDPRPKATEWRNNAELAGGVVRQEGSSIPIDARPKAARSKQYEDQTSRQSQAQEEPQL